MPGPSQCNYQAKFNAPRRSTVTETQRLARRVLFHPWSFIGHLNSLSVEHGEGKAWLGWNPRQKGGLGTTKASKSKIRLLTYIQLTSFGWIVNGDYIQIKSVLDQKTIHSSCNICPKKKASHGKQGNSPKCSLQGCQINLEQQHRPPTGQTPPSPVEQPAQFHPTLSSKPPFSDRS